MIDKVLIERRKDKERNVYDSNIEDDSYPCLLWISVCISPLVLAGTEFIFFIKPHILLPFKFVSKRVLITRKSFTYCQAVLTQPQDLSSSSPPPTSYEAGSAQEFGRGHNQDS